MYLDVAGGVGRELDDEAVRSQVGDVRFGTGRSAEQGLGLELDDGLSTHTHAPSVAIQKLRSFAKTWCSPPTGYGRWSRGRSGNNKQQQCDNRKREERCFHISCCGF